MNSFMTRNALGRLLHEMTEARGGRFYRWSQLPPEAQEDYCCIAEAFCFNASWPIVKPRTFDADVTVMGGRALGVCRVTEAAMAGVVMLRCEAADGVVEWVNPAAVVTVRELPAKAGE